MKDENNFYFMDPKTFDQIEINKEIVGVKGNLLTENLEASVNIIMKIQFQLYYNQIRCKINTTDAALKGQTVSSSYKPAILDNGVKIKNHRLLKPVMKFY